MKAVLQESIDRAYAFLGIDPGKSGAAVYLDGGARFICGIDFSKTERDVSDFFESRLIATPNRKAFIEKVTGRGGWGATQNFRFGQSLGFLRGLLIAHRIPFEEVTPKRWQAALGIKFPKGSTHAERKRVTKARAQELFPDVDITKANADALLIAEYGRRLNIRVRA